MTGTGRIHAMMWILCILCVFRFQLKSANAQEKARPAGWRGDGSGHFPDANPPLKWSMKGDQPTNIVWQTEMPNMSCSSVIAAGERLFTTCNDCDLICVDKKTGKIIWVRSVSPYDAATKEEREAHKDAFLQLDALAKKRDDLAAKIPSAAQAGVPKLGEEMLKIEREMDKLLTGTDKVKYKNTGMSWSDGGYMAATPASDGACVYAWNGWGVTACFDLEGNRKWIRFDSLRWQEHGLYSSPLLIGDTLITCLGRQYLALDKRTGKDAWKAEIHSEEGGRYWYGSHVPMRIGAEDVILAGDGSLIRARDGVRFLKGAGYVSTPSPVAGDGFVCWMGGLRESPLKYYALPKTADTPSAPQIKIAELDTKGIEYINSSPLICNGLVYIVSANAILLVFDLAAEKLVYRKELDFGEQPKRSDRPYGCGVGASPSFAGGKIFLVGNFGTTLILEPGREYKEVGRNTIDRPIAFNYKNDAREGTISCPFFEGTRIYYRAQRYLYCIGER